MKHLSLSLSLAIALAALGCAGEQDDSTVGGTPSNGGGGASSDGGSGGLGGGPVGGSPEGGGGQGCEQDCSTIETPVCYIATCNEQTGICEIGPEPDDAPCDDGLFCTVNDVCLDGECQSGAPYVCKGAEDECVLLVCDEDLDSCTGGSVPNGQPCSSPNVCESNAICQNGNCQGAPTDCSAFPAPDCQASACNPANGQCEPSPDASQNGTACTDAGDPCQVAKTCDAGTCANGVPKDCSALDIGCQNGVCNAVTGICEGVAVPTGGQCNSGTNDCNTGICNAAQQCVLSPVVDGTTCEDFSTCSVGNTCISGACGVVDPNCSIYLEQSFETCPAPGWVLSGEWQCGQPTLVGPSAAFEGTNVIGTILNGNYANSQSYDVDFAQTPPIGLGLADEPVLSYRHWVDTEGSIYDGYNIKISTDGGTTFTVLTSVSPPYNLPGVGGQPAWGEETFANVWSPVVVDLAPYAGQQIVLRFSFRSDGSIVRPGVYIDDVQVGEAVNVPLVIETSSVSNALATFPYAETVAKSGGTTNAQWSITGGSNIAWLSIDPDTGALSGTPSLAELGPVSVNIHVEEPLNPTNFDDQTLTFSVQTGIFSQGFEGACPNGWTMGGSWQCGTPVTGPGSALGGTQAVACVLNGSYTDNLVFGTNHTTSNVIDLTGTTAPSLHFWTWYQTESCCDGFNVKISNNGGASYTVATAVTPAYSNLNLGATGEPAWTGTSTGWVEHVVDLSAFAGDQINLRFAFRTDGSVTNPGVFIDNLTIVD
jgi:hypothetical protein